MSQAIDALEKETGAAAAAPAQMLRLLYGSLVTQLLAVAAELGVADLLADGPQSVEQLAERTQTSAEALHRMLRALASTGVFTETAAGVFALTPLAEIMREDADGSLRHLAMLIGSGEVNRTLAELGFSARTGRPAFDEVHGTDWWSYLAANPDWAGVFHRAMGGLARQMQAAAVESYDLAGVSRVVDVGGGQGHLAALLLERYEDMTAVVFDLPEGLAGAREVLAEAGVAERAELVSGDFFTGVPAGGDAYVLSSILHDWSDEEATAILRNVGEAMDPEGQVIVIDTAIPEGDGAHLGKLLDIAMLAQHTGRERTEAEIVGLLASAGFAHARTVGIPSWPTSLVIAEPAPGRRSAGSSVVGSNSVE